MAGKNTTSSPAEIEMTETPVRGLVRPLLRPMSFRLPSDIPQLLREGTALAAQDGDQLSRDAIVAQAVREWVSRKREQSAQRGDRR